MSTTFRTGMRIQAPEDQIDIPDLLVIAIKPRSFGGEQCGDSLEMSPLLVCSTAFGASITLTRQELQELYNI